MRQIASSKAPNVIGTYSQAIRVDKTVYISGQIPLDPATQVLCSEDIHAQITQVIQNLEAVCVAAEGSLAEVAKVTVYLMDLTHSTLVNDLMKAYFKEPYPARVTIQVAGLPRGAQIEIDAIMVLR